VKKSQVLNLHQSSQLEIDLRTVVENKRTNQVLNLHQSSQLEIDLRTVVENKKTNQVLNLHRSSQLVFDLRTNLWILRLTGFLNSQLGTDGEGPIY
jgi:hypothetical protein